MCNNGFEIFGLKIQNAFIQRVELSKILVKSRAESGSTSIAKLKKHCRVIAYATYLSCEVGSYHTGQMGVVGTERTHGVASDGLET